MSEIINQIIALVEQIILAGGYPGIVLVMFIENIFPPIPSELIMPFAGFLAGQGEGLSLVGVWLAGTLGSLLGAIALYYAGWLAGDVVIRRFLRRYGRWIGITEQEYDRGLHFFRRYGEWIVLVGRVIPFIRSVISIPAGAERMSMPRFLLFTTIGSLAWSGLLAVAGYILGDRWHEIQALIDPIADVVLMAVVIAAVILAGFIFVRRLRQRPVEQETI